MRISVLQETLETALSSVVKAVPTKPQLPILSSIHVQVSDTTCVLSATDLYFGVQTAITVEVFEPGTLVIPGKYFKELISSLPKGPLTISSTATGVEIQSKHSSSTLQCHAAEEYPPFPEITGEAASFHTAVLSDISTLVSFAASQDQARPVLTTVLFEPAHTPGGSCRVVSTDGFRLALLEIAAESFPAVQARSLIPARALAEVERIAEAQAVVELTITISQESKQVLFGVGSSTIYVRLIDGEYPPYEKIIPDSFLTTVQFDMGELIDALKRTLIFARESSNIVRLHIEPEKIELSASSPTLGSSVAQLEHVSLKGSGGDIAFNARYVLDFLQAVGGDSVELGMNESLRPARFTSPTRQELQYVVMPFKVNTEKESR